MPDLVDEDGSIRLPPATLDYLRRRYAPPVDWSVDPVGWVGERFPDIHLWSKQREIMESVRDHARTGVKSSHSTGKALALDTPILTPDGWSTMGKLSPGDRVFDENGNPCYVNLKSPIEKRLSFEVEFSDGSVIVAADNHEWNVLDFKNRRRVTFVEDLRSTWDLTDRYTTAELYALGLTSSNGKTKASRWRIPCAKPLNFDRKEWYLPFSPYAFGAWLGDGTTVRAEVTASADDIEEMHRLVNGTSIRKTNTAFVSTLTDSVYVDVPWFGKRIPDWVLQGDERVRLAVLRGIVDTDGYVQVKSRAVVIEMVSEPLMRDVQELIHSLGWQTFWSESEARLNGRYIGQVYGVSFTPDINPCLLSRKVERWDRANSKVSHVSKMTARSIVDIRPIGEIDVQCIEVDSPSHLYLAGRSLIPTHNSFISALIVAWWIESHPPGTAFVVTSAPTGDQVKAILWRELNRRHKEGGLRGRMNLVEWYDDSGELVAIGRKTSDYSASSFQGLHAQFLLVLLDEACGISPLLWGGAETLASNEAARICAVGNPDDPQAEFAHFCADEGTHTIRISAFDSPNFTGEDVPERVRKMLVSVDWVEARKRKWGENSPLYVSKVLGDFPTDVTDGVVPGSWAARCRLLELQPSGDVELGVDVAGGGADRTVVWARQGPVALRKWERRGEQDPLALADWVLEIVQMMNAKVLKYDAIGVGWALGGTLNGWHRDGRHDCVCVPVRVSESAEESEEFLNLRAELWWMLRKLTQENAVDLRALDDDDAAEVTCVRYHTNNPRGRTQVEKKDEIRKRLGESPDSADALILSLYTPIFNVEPAVTEIVEARLPGVGRYR